MGKLIEAEENGGCWGLGEMEMGRYKSKDTNSQIKEKVLRI